MNTTETKNTTLNQHYWKVLDTMSWASAQVALFEKGLDNMTSNNEYGTLEVYDVE